jgi:hypothetical protein
MHPEIHPAEANVPAPASDLPPVHPRRGIPRVTVILGVGLLAAVTFLAGIEAQKQWGGNGSDANGFGARAAAFRAAAGGNGGAQGAAPGAGAFGRGGGGVTTGKVKLVQGSNIYVTTTDGNTVKVTVPSSTAITKSVTTKLSGVHPGDNVTAIGTSSSDGVIKAVSVRLGDAGFPGFGGRRPGAQGAAPGTNGG